MYCIMDNFSTDNIKIEPFTKFSEICQEISLEHTVLVKIKKHEKIIILSSHKDVESLRKEMREKFKKTTIIV